MHRHLTLFRELDGVVNQVDQNLNEFLPVCDHSVRSFLRSGNGQLQSLACRLGQEHRLQVFQQLLQAEVRFLKVQPSRLNLGNLQHIIDQVQQMFAAFDDGLQILPVPLRQAGLSQHHFGETENRVHRSSDFMRHIGHKSALEPVRLLGCFLGLLQDNQHLFVVRDILHHPDGADYFSCRIPQMLPSFQNIANLTAMPANDAVLHFIILPRGF